jgi:nucleotide-binding universal stress UspA family protein
MSEPLPTAPSLYGTILVTLDTTATDRAIIDHVKRLAREARSRRVVLLHVADGWAARLHGSEAVSPEISEDTVYLRRVRDELRAEGIPAEVALAYGNPADEIVAWIRREGCDLVAMSTHGHRFLADLFLGTTAHRVQHRVHVPVLLLRAS